MRSNVMVIYFIVGTIFLSAFAESCIKYGSNTPATTTTPPPATGDVVTMGRNLFFDKKLSNPVGQSCATCHSPDAGFSDRVHSIVSEGAVTGLFGNRNAPAIAYSMYSTDLHFDSANSTYVGGFFYDGRTNSLEEQAQKPFLNPLEMANGNPDLVVSKLKRADYYALYQKVYGDVKDINEAFINISKAIAAFERSPEVNPFTSKYDYYLKGQATLTAAEQAGLLLFNDTAKGKCANCHPSTVDSRTAQVLFTDFTYDNIGVPKNPDNPFYTIDLSFNPLGSRAVDKGLGGFLNDINYNGQFKVPTLRNVALSAPYFHNGYFNTLEDVVHFYNTRDLGGFPAAETPQTVNHDETGNLNLTPQEEKNIVAFLKTLTDGYK